MDPGGRCERSRIGFRHSRESRGHSPHPPGPTSLERRPAAGFHEVIIESPRHAPGMPRLEPEHLQSLFRVFRDRVREVEGRPGISSVILFENWGPESGGTLWHPHVQLLGTGPVPPRLAD